MSDKQCPGEAELLAFADADLPPEQLDRIEKHLELCGACTKQVLALQALIADIAAPLAPARLDVAEHVAGVMRRLDVPARASRGSRWAVWGTVLAAAAAAVVVVALSRGNDAPRGHFAARGEPAQASLSRDLGVQLYAQESPLRALESGSRIRAGSALTAGLRNLASEPAYLLLFAVDARQAVHWIAPEFTAAGSDPEAAAVAPSASERLLPSAATFDDLAPGPLRVVAVITREPTHVSEVEALSAAELSGEGLMKRFPRAEIRQFRLQVTP